ncbi:hypothetical protein VNO78_17589 [Psophocarpus tetragonolobus]|uniref:Uncharacterized protein n=1 Tax=Psophocarpus tetragonolobus TaxID=3891 RepID=A0AAN9XLG4_PSOTE
MHPPHEVRNFKTLYIRLEGRKEGETEKELRHAANFPNSGDGLFSVFFSSLEFSCFMVKESTTCNLTGIEKMGGGASSWDRII